MMTCLQLRQRNPEFPRHSHRTLKQRANIRFRDPFGPPFGRLANA
jgi:hypothetical protein